MNKEAFHQLLQNPGYIAPDYLESLEELVRLFPYCSLAHVLIAKSHYDQATMLASQKLRKAAAYAVNRDKLKKIITGEWPAYEQPAASIPVSSLIEEPVEMTVPDEPRAKSVAVVETYPDTELIEQEIVAREDEEKEEEVEEVVAVQEEVTAEELVIDTPSELLFDRLVVPLQQPEEPAGVEPEPQDEQEEPPLQLGHLNENDLVVEEFSRRTKKNVQWEIIESFIRSEPRISSLNVSEKDPLATRDLSEKSTQPVNLVSENMANIYVRQRRYDKAIEMFEKLIVKYPEKKAYFAERIQDLKQF